MSGRNLDRRKVMAVSAAVYLSVLAACGCVLLAAPRGHLSPTERDFIIAVAISANIYAILSTTRMCRVIFSGTGAGAGVSSGGVETIIGDGVRPDDQNGTAVEIGTCLLLLRSIQCNFAVLPSYDDAISSPAYTRPLFIRDADAETF